MLVLVLDLGVLFEDENEDEDEEGNAEPGECAEGLTIWRERRGPGGKGGRRQAGGLDCSSIDPLLFLYCSSTGGGVLPQARIAKAGEVAWRARQPCHAVFMRS